MTAPEIVTWIGTACSAIGAGIAIWQASLARSFKNQIRVDIRKLHVMRSAEQLRKALDSIRKLPSDKSNIPRGHQAEKLVEGIKECFDDVLGILVIDGDEEDIRNEVSFAQADLTTYEHHLSAGTPSPDLTAAIRSRVQNAVSLANNRVLKIEGKA